MKLPKCFALSTLLLLMLGVAAVFGYAQWRRQWLIAEVEKINSEADPVIRSLSRSGPIGVTDSWFWPTVAADGAGAAITMDANGGLTANGKIFTVKEAQEYLAEKAERLHRIGMRHVVFCLVTTDSRSGKPRLRVLKKLSELDAQ